MASGLIAPSFGDPGDKIYVPPAYDGEKVYIGIPRERFAFHRFVDNRDRIFRHLNKLGLMLEVFQAEGHRVDRNRDHIVWAFVHHEDKPEWLFMMDTDMEFPETVVERLMSWRKPIIGGLYFHRGHHDPLAFISTKPAVDKYGRLNKMWEPIRDIVYDFMEANGVPYRSGAFTMDGYSGDALIEVDALGTGCILIHRSVLENMQPPWFEYQIPTMSEDIQFCHFAKRDFGIPIYVDISTVCGHFKDEPLGQAEFRRGYRRRGFDHTKHTPEEAAGLLAEYLDIDADAAMDMVTKYHPRALGEMWMKLHPKSDDDVNSFYSNESIGNMYLVDLLRWNTSPSFNLARADLIPWRNMDVLEIGSGIGTVSIQMYFQRCNVTAVEPNSVLRDFSKWHFNWISDRVYGKAGSIRFVGDPMVDTSIELGMYNLIISLEVFEHIHSSRLPGMLRFYSSLLKKRGQMFITTNWGDQDLYPMHYDHSEAWEDYIEEAGLCHINDHWLLKVRDTT